MNPSASPWVRFRTLTFRRLEYPSTTAAGIPGFSCRRARQRLTKIPLDQNLLACRNVGEVTPGRSSDTDAPPAGLRRLDAASVDLLP